jgi:hypothetical protein
MAPCGINCSDCDAYKATQQDDAELRQKMADAYRKQFNKEIDPADLNCDGCPAEGRHISFCNKCEIRSCAAGKSYGTCAECIEFPCAKGSFIWTENSKSRATLENLR